MNRGPGGGRVDPNSPEIAPEPDIVIKSKSIDIGKNGHEGTISTFMRMAQN